MKKEPNLNLNRAQVPILVVEDDSFFRNVVCTILSNIGFQNITEADSGRSASTLLSKKRFQLILSDVQMPFMNGLQLLQQIRTGQTPAPRDTRVMILTSFSNTEVLGAALALDVNGFLVKPMNQKDVLTKIRGALGETIGLKSELIYKAINTNLDLLTAAKTSRTVRAGGAPTPCKQNVTLPNTSAIPNAEEKSSPHKQNVTLAKPPAKPNTEENSNNLRQVSIFDLQPGVYLAKDILFRDGTLLLSAGPKLDQVIINRLRELQIMLEKITVWVSDSV